MESSSYSLCLRLAVLSISTGNLSVLKSHTEWQCEFHVDINKNIYKSYHIETIRLEVFLHSRDISGTMLKAALNPDFSQASGR